jgi:hypothetical protein
MGRKSHCTHSSGCFRCEGARLAPRPRTLVWLTDASSDMDMVAIGPEPRRLRPVAPRRPCAVPPPPPPPPPTLDSSTTVDPPSPSSVSSPPPDSSLSSSPSSATAAAPCLLHGKFNGAGGQAMRGLVGWFEASIAPAQAFPPYLTFHLP